MKHILLFAIALALVGCGSLGSGQATDFDLPGEVAVTFQVLLPENSTGDEPLYLTLLDTLTGELINPLHLEMQKDGERSYTVEVSAPVGSVLEYRYTLGEGKLPEAGKAGVNFSHRRFYVDGPAHVVTDVIVVWRGEEIEFEDGAIHGQIVSAEGGAALGNIVINVSGVETRSSVDGEFIVGGLQQGLHNIVALSPSGDYLPFQQGALVAAGTETPAVFEMQPVEALTVNFLVSLPEDHVPGVPLFLISNLAGQQKLQPDSYNAEGQAVFTVELPSLQDIRYKYSLGDGFWNAEHLATGEYLTRQIILDPEMDGIVIADQVGSWQAGRSAPIWFEASLAAPQGEAPYIQFRFTDWTEAIQMWPLGEGQYAYKLNSPTNFAAPLQYRYCQDAFCLHPEDFEGTRSVTGNLEAIQYSEDRIEAWK